MKGVQNSLSLMLQVWLTGRQCWWQVWVCSCKCLACNDSSVWIGWRHSNDRRDWAKTHCSLVMLNCMENLGQYWLRWWLAAARHHAIAWTSDDLPSTRFPGINSRVIFTWIRNISITVLYLKSQGWINQKHRWDNCRAAKFYINCIFNDVYTMNNHANLNKMNRDSTAIWTKFQI